MSEPKFTKGPWQAHGTQHQDWVETEWKAKKGPDFQPTTTYICKCGRDNGFYDAILIAAAPEMYALLLDIVTDYQCMPNPAVMADKIEAVLKKARGEE